MIKFDGHFNKQPQKLHIYDFIIEENQGNKTNTNMLPFGMMAVG